MKQVPRSIEKRISLLSASEKIFIEWRNYNEKRLKNSGYMEKLKFNLKQKKAHKETEGCGVLTLLSSPHLWANPLELLLNP